MNGFFFRVSLILAVAVAWLLPADSAQAGAMFFAGKLDGEKFVVDESAEGPIFAVRYSTINITVAKDRVSTEVEESLQGSAKAAKHVLCVIPLPVGTDVLDRTAFEPVFNWSGDMQMLSVEKARTVYEALAKATGNVSILAYGGQPALVTDQLPEGWLDGKVTVRYAYRNAVKHRDGICELTSPMPATTVTKTPVKRFSVTVTLQDKLPLRAVFSPSHAATVERDGLHEATVRAKADNWSEADDFRLCWVADQDDLGLRVLAYRDADDTDGYFMLIGNPTGGAEAEKAIEKDVMFVLDTSGSMRGEKIEQARAAIEYCLEQLNPGDRFNIITFGTEVEAFHRGVVAKSESTLDSAREFIENVVARGRTNISGALAEALPGKPAKDRPRITIFLTDGTPTAGELVPEKIVEEVEKANTSGSRIFVMGLGHDVNAHLLDKLAEMTDGSSEYVDPDEEIDAKVAGLYDRLSHPVLTGVEVAFGELRPHSVYPEKLPALFKGSEVMIAGRYREGGRHTFTVSGTLAGEPVEYSATAELPGKPNGTDNDFVAPLWAARKIGYLLQEIRLHGENAELIEEVVKLSKKFGIVTEYTTFIALAGREMTDEAAIGFARAQMERANMQQAGQWAVNQARNDFDLQNRKVAGKAGNTYRDRRGRVVANENIGQIGRQVFYLRDGQWVDGQEAGDRKKRVVELFSEEYFDLMRNNRQFSRAQQLGWAMEANVGAERIVVERNGEQQSEELRERQQEMPAPVMNQGNMQQNMNQFQQIQQGQFRNQQLRINDFNNGPNRAINQAPVQQELQEELQQ
ncbi:MAG: VWA domain-containing protein [Planctomycetes bacterium]|nr:VWA domain-containing protein [Planctomycetota bacterium]